jgi:hypothetical protein
MELEKQLGFRSSFNFVPEGYEMTNRVLKTLRESDFGIGVHGLVHDEKLFGYRKVFERRAPRINNYLKKWGAVGFHSPAMIRNLDWIGELDIEYDGSTFDTDPFEPQPDGVRTIFPFLVQKNSGQPAPWNSGDSRTIPLGRSALSSQLLPPADRRRQTADSAIAQHPSNSSNPMNSSNSMDSSNSTDSSNSMNPTNSRKSYVELPYTLPQDHCLFVILKQRDIRIWKQKLDWIVEKGGMALLNAHPDYMSFGGGAMGREQYRVELYEEFLSYVRDKYPGQYWNVLSSEVARFWRENMAHHCTGPERTGLKFDGAT